MANIFLSPSSQYYNLYVTGGDERYYMNLLADELERYLNSNAIQFTRNRPDMTAAQSIEASNEGNYDLHLALHSNAAPEGSSGKYRGSDIYHYPNSAKGIKAAGFIVEQMKRIYPIPERVRALSTTTIGEVAKTKAPAVLAEIAYHDNKEDATWIINNIPKIAEAFGKALADYFGRPFVAPITPRVGVITVKRGRLNIRETPSLDAEIIGHARDGDTLTIFGKYKDWYSVQFGEIKGFASSSYIR